MGHSQEEGRLGLSPGRCVNARAVTRLTRLDPAAVDHHNGQRDRRARGRGRRVQGAVAEGLAPGLALFDELLADFSAERLEVTRRNLQRGGDPQDLGGFLEGAGRGRRADGLSEGPRAVTSVIETLLDSVGGKTLAGSASSNIGLLGVGWVRPERATRG